LRFSSSQEGYPTDEELQQVLKPLALHPQPQDEFESLLVR